MVHVPVASVVEVDTSASAGAAAPAAPDCWEAQTQSDSWAGSRTRRPSAQTQADSWGPLGSARPHGGLAAAAPGGDMPPTVEEAVRAAEEAVARLRQLGLKAGGSSSASSTTADDGGRSDASVRSSGSGAEPAPDSRSRGAAQRAQRPVGVRALGGARLPGGAGASRPLAEGAPAGVFRRPLRDEEMAVVQALVEQPSRRRLRDLAAQAYGWAKHDAAGRPGVGVESATAALRHLAYLQGLPTLDERAARWHFERHSEDLSEVAGHEFEEAVEVIFRCALLGR